MNHLTLSLSMAAVLALSGISFADQQDQGQKRERFRAKQGTERAANARAVRSDKGQAGQFDPQMVVSRLLKQFDVDGDEKLDIDELTKLMTSLRERRQSGATQGQRDRAMGNGQRDMRSAQGKNRQRPATGDQGGDRPARPSAE